MVRKVLRLIGWRVLALVEARVNWRAWLSVVGSLSSELVLASGVGVVALTDVVNTASLGCCWCELALLPADGAREEGEETEEKSVETNGGALVPLSLTSLSVAL